MVMNLETFVFDCLQQGGQKDISINIQLHLLALEQCFRLGVIVLDCNVDGLSCKRRNGWPLVAIILLSFNWIAWPKAGVQ